MGNRKKTLALACLARLFTLAVELGALAGATRNYAFTILPHLIATDDHDSGRTVHRLLV